MPKELKEGIKIQGKPGHRDPQGSWADTQMTHPRASTVHVGQAGRGGTGCPCHQGQMEKGPDRNHRGTA